MNIYNLKQISTPRLIIRPVQAGDEIGLNLSINRSLELLQRWMPWAHDPSLQTTRDHVQRAVVGWQSSQAIEFQMVAIHKESQTIVAATGFNDRSVLEIPSFEAGYWMDSGYQGQGLVTELLNALTRFALVALDAKRVQINAHVDNHKSIAVAKRCHFTYEATMKNERLDSLSGKPADSVLYSCTEVAMLPPLNVNWSELDENI